MEIYSLSIYFHGVIADVYLRCLLCVFFSILVCSNFSMCICSEMCETHEYDTAIFVETNKCLILKAVMYLNSYIGVSVTQCRMTLGLFNRVKFVLCCNCFGFSSLYCYLLICILLLLLREDVKINPGPVSVKLKSLSLCRKYKRFESN